MIEQMPSVAYCYDDKDIPLVIHYGKKQRNFTSYSQAIEFCEEMNIDPEMLPG